MRSCLLCQSTTTYTDKKYQWWYKLESAFICLSCYCKLISNDHNLTLQLSQIDKRLQRGRTGKCQ